MTEPKKHHYLPIFYLKQWADVDGRLCQYSRPYDMVKPSRKHPDATGYELELYTVAGVPPESAQIVEKRFMRKTDDLAAQAMRMLLAGNASTMATELKSGWARFILGLLLRHPDFVAFLKKEVRLNSVKKMEEKGIPYEQWRRPHEPKSLEEFHSSLESLPMEASEAIGLQQMIDNPRVGSFLNNMRWFVFELIHPKHTLMTSDRPVVMSNGIAHPDSFLLLPMGPLHFFAAVNAVAIENRIKDILDQRRFDALMNNAIVRQAQK